MAAAAERSTLCPPSNDPRGVAALPPAAASAAPPTATVTATAAAVPLLSHYGLARR